MSSFLPRCPFLVSAFAVAVAASPRALPGQAPPVVDSIFAEMHSSTGPGCTIAFDSGGRRQWIAAFGRADLERGGMNDSTTIFEAGSVSKQLTAAAIILLARGGRLSLDDPLRRWIPEFPELAPITVRMLLTHRSGLRDWRNLSEMHRWNSDNAAYRNADVLALLRRQRSLNFEPGAEYSYSNSNYVLAAIVVERVTGESFRAFTTRAIFGPLGMRSTSWRDTAGEIVPGRARAYSPDDAGRFTDNTPVETVVGPGGLMTTVPDLMAWLRNLDTEQVGGAGFREAMERVSVLRSGRSTQYAMGLEISTLGGERLVSHAGWTGGYVAWAGRLPARGLALGILCNGNAINTEDLGPALLARLARLPAPTADQAPDLGTAGANGGSASLAGLFRSQRNDQLVTVRAFARGVTLNAWNGYAAVGDGTYRSIDGTRTLNRSRDSTGRVNAFRVRHRNGDAVAYVRLDTTLSTAKELPAYAGRYRSDETDAEMQILVGTKTLIVERGGVLRDTLRATFRDGFRAPSQSWVLTFRRDPGGRVSGFDLGLPRSRRIRFERMAGSGNR